MSELASPSLSALLAETDKSASAEQQLFIHSPFGTFWTSVIVFVLLCASFALIASAAHEDWLAPGPGGTLLPPVTRNALILALLIATALGVQRYSRTKDRSEIAHYPPLLRNGPMRMEHFAMLTPSGARLRTATVGGLILGLAVSFLLLPRSPLAPHGTFDPVFAWVATAVTFLSILFVRGVELTRSSSRSTRQFIDEEVKIDLLRIDQLQVIGRSAARVALIWFSITAVTCLFFVEGEPTLFTFGLLFGCAAMGIWIFVRTMEHMHEKIVAAKSLELERIRARIDELSRDMHEDADAATKLQGALAYEARISAVHEWPFDQPTLLRVGASALILTVPWFGQAVAGIVVDKLGGWIH